MVKQVNSGGGAMPSFKGKLTDAQIQELADYVSDERGQELARQGDARESGDAGMTRG